MNRATVSTLILLAIFCLPVKSLATEAKQNREPGRWALLIGVDKYAEMGELEFSGADMLALREALVAGGFPEQQVFTLHDKAVETKYRPMKANIERQLDLMLDMVEPSDVLIVGFSGHGVHLDGRSYLCPVEAQAENPKTLVPLDDVYRKLEKSQAAMKLFLVDACRKSPHRGGEKSARIADGTKQFAESLERPPRGILLMTSCAPGQVACEDSLLKHGVFMHFLLEGIYGRVDVDKKGQLPVLAIYMYANQETKAYVLRTRNKAQTPSLRGDIPDNVELLPSLARLRASQFLVTGLDAAAEHRGTEAIKAFSEAARLDPKNVHAFLGLGMASDWMARRDEALAALNRAIALDPGNAQAYHARAVCLSKKDSQSSQAAADLDRAYELCSDAISRKSPFVTLPTVSWWRIHRSSLQSANATVFPAAGRSDESLLAAVYLLRSQVARSRAYRTKSEEDFRSARDDANEASRHDPQMADAYVARAKLHHHFRDFDALADCNRAIALDGKSAEFLVVRACIHNDRGLFEKSVADATEAIRLNADNDSAYYLRAMARIGLKQYDEAIADCSRAIASNDRYSEAYRLRANARNAKTEFSKALADAARAIELDEKNAYAYLERAVTELGLRLFDEAVADCSKAVAIDDRNSNAYRLRARAHNAKRDFSKALLDAARAIELDGNSEYAYLERAMAHLELNLFDESIADSSKAIAINDRSGNAYRLRARAHNGKSDFSKASVDASRAIELDGNNVLAYQERARANIGLRRFDEAISDCDKAIAINGKEGWFYAFRSRAHRGNQEFDEALVDAEKAVQLSPSEPWIRSQVDYARRRVPVK